MSNSPYKKYRVEQSENGHLWYVWRDDYNTSGEVNRGIVSINFSKDAAMLRMITLRGH